MPGPTCTCRQTHATLITESTYVDQSDSKKVGGIVH